MNNSTKRIIRLNGDLKRKYFFNADAAARTGGRGGEETRRFEVDNGKCLEPLKRRRSKRLVVVVVTVDDVDDVVVVVDVLLVLALKNSLSLFIRSIVINRKSKKSGDNVIFISFREKISISKFSFLDRREINRNLAAQLKAKMHFDDDDNKDDVGRANTTDAQRKENDDGKEEQQQNREQNDRCETTTLNHHDGLYLFLFQ